MAKEVELLITAEKDGKKIEREEVEKIIDREVERFSEFMSSLPDWRAQGALSRPEKMLMKTYFIQKLRGRLDGEG